MADATIAPIPGDAAKAVEDSTRPVDTTVNPSVAEAKPVNGDDVATAGDVAEESTSPATKEDPLPDQPIATDAKADDATGEDDLATVPSASAANGTPASKKGSNGRRKSGANLPEHKKKTPSKKKKATAELHLDVQPGEIRFVAMRGYQPWPVIVCDEEMLPEILLSKRPVSAKRIDGTYREDFLEGGKNAKDRRYPIMFLGTNEFAWQINTELQPFDLEEVQSEVKAGNNTKKSKALWEAYEIAAENHDLAWFKEMLNNHDKALLEEMEKVQIEEADKQQKKKEKAGKRKSVAAEDSEDIEMEDAADDGAASTKKAKVSKKRKKDIESDGEQEKPAKTPKTKLKLNNKTPKEASAAKPKKEQKPKKTPKAKSESEEVEPVVEEKPLTEAERLEKREKSVLYLRHRLQKGFLSRDQAPKEEEMDNMSDYLRQLEGHQDLEAEVIKKTKVHKVLKAIIKLNSIPKEEEYQFKKRSNGLLTKWLAAETEIASETLNAAEPATNGVKHDEEKADADKTEPKPAETESAKATDGDGDVSVANVAKVTDAVKTDSGSNAEDAAANVPVA
ncbi:hypothetical protein K505DRAFT_231757 [Melanomma pulvis-pyrius CBS 109.77]|uniref:PWWP domain-containing protein n=1 Tax=Melanomma pulvis-pyrius CBS 109.77 TaxID=1314802 RepID=A0A6A6XSV4_9PLEO|nr:hypothetical protein K505DRAFT_231757 [Melanomma pulvis-pyrius CBS 109.77]